MSPSAWRRSPHKGGLARFRSVLEAQDDEDADEDATRMDDEYEARILGALAAQVQDSCSDMPDAALISTCYREF